MNKPKNISRFWYAFTMLLIWDPDRIPNDTKVSKQFKLFYKAKGIVLFDRALNGEPLKVDTNG